MTTKPAPEPGGDARGRPPRRLRSDAEANRDRLLAAAASAMTREGRQVPLAVIAAEAGVGVATLYRKYADRDALMQELERRAYALLTEILGDIARRDPPGLEAIGEFLARTVEIASRLVLPLHGAPPLVTTEAVAARQEIDSRLGGRSRINAARTARSAQSSRGRGWVRRSTATSCRSTSSSASLEAGDRPGRTSQLHSRAKMR